MTETLPRRSGGPELFCAGAVLGAAGLSAAFSAGTHTTPDALVLEAAGLGLLLVCSTLIPDLVGRPRVSASVVLLTGILGVPALGWAGGTVAGLLLATLGVLLFAATAVTAVRLAGLRSSVTLFVGGVMLGLAAWSVACQRSYHGVSTDLAVLTQATHRDTLYHVASTQMFDLFGVPNTALDGVKYLPYHVGSHIWAALTNRLFGTTAFEFYGFGFVVLLAGVFARAFLLVAEAMSARLGAPGAQSRAFWLVAGIFLIVPLPPTAAHAAVVGWNSQYLSESYGLGMALLLCLFAAALELKLDQRVQGPTSVRTVSIVFGVGVVLGLIGIIKISVFFVAGAGLGWFLLRTPGIALPVRAIGFATLAAFSLLLQRYFAMGAEGHSGLKPLAFYMGYVPFEWWSWHLFLFGAPVVLWVTERFRALGLTVRAGFRSAVQQRKMIETEALLAATVAGVLPGLVWAIGGGSAYYFLDVPRWFVAPAVVALASAGAWQGAASATGGPRTGLRLVLAFVLLSQVSSVFSQVAGAVVDHLDVRIKVTGDSCDAKDWTETLKCARRLGFSKLADLRGAIAQHPRAPLLNSLRELARLSPAERRHTALFVPSASTAFWDGYPTKPMAPLTAPALGCVASVGGVPDGGVGTNALGYGAFAGRTTEDVDEQQRRARALGFDVLVTLEDQGQGLALHRHPATEP